jgi:ATPase subunit of ABC transporter with duplicated ATPase domains
LFLFHRFNAQLYRKFTQTHWSDKVSTDTEKVIYSMIKVSKYYDKKPVLKDISLSYFYGAKIGVLGLNGSGKSTLLRIMAGVDTNFNGETILTKGFTIGYLEQEPLVDVEKSVRQVVEEGVQETVDLLKEFEEINSRFAEPMDDDAMDKLIQRQGEVQEKPRFSEWSPIRIFLIKVFFVLVTRYRASSFHPSSRPRGG